MFQQGTWEQGKAKENNIGAKAQLNCFDLMNMVI